MIDDYLYYCYYIIKKKYSSISISSRNSRIREVIEANDMTNTLAHSTLQKVITSKALMVTIRAKIEEQETV